MAPDGRRFQVVALAASAGGLAAISAVLRELPATVGVPVLVVMHLDPSRTSLLSSILTKVTSLTVKDAEAGAALDPGTVYLAPPDHHLMVDEDRRIALTHTALVHFVRPSADLLFESVAQVYGPGAIAVVLTGSGSDGAMGVEAIKARGGTVIAQDKETSDFYGMPGAATATGAVDFVLPLFDVAPRIVELVEESPLNGHA